MTPQLTRFICTDCGRMYDDISDRVHCICGAKFYPPQPTDKLEEVEEYKKEFIDTYDLCERINLDKREILSSLVVGFYKQQRRSFIELVKGKIKNFQMLYGNFNSSTGVLMGYKTNEYGSDPVDIFIEYLLKELSKEK